jgi:hypothetical protein
VRAWTSTASGHFTALAEPRTQWYREAIPLAEQRYERYLKERRDEEEQQR